MFLKARKYEYDSVSLLDDIMLQSVCASVQSYDDNYT